MKKLIYPVLFVFVAFMAACDVAPTTEEAIDFNDAIVADQSDLIDYNQEFLDAYNYDEIDVIEEAMYDLQDFIEEQMEEYEAMEAFDEEDIFRTAYMDLLEIFEELAFEDYPALIEMWQYDEPDYDDIADFEEEINEKSAQANEDFLEAQEDFADQYGFTLK